MVGRPFAPWRTLTVSVPVPRYISTRTVSYMVPNPLIYSRYFRRLELPAVRPTDFVMRPIQVRVPRTRLSPALLGAMHWSASMTRHGGRVVVGSRRSTARLLSGSKRWPAGEWNRVRLAERKYRSLKFSSGQMESVRHDPHGMIAAAVQRGLSPTRIADTAMVVRAFVHSANKARKGSRIRTAHFLRKAKRYVRH